MILLLNNHQIIRPSDHQIICSLSELWRPLIRYIETLGVLYIALHMMQDPYSYFCKLGVCALYTKISYNALYQICENYEVLWIVQLRYKVPRSDFWSDRHLWKCLLLNDHPLISSHRLQNMKNWESYHEILNSQVSKQNMDSLRIKLLQHCAQVASRMVNWLLAK